VTGVVLLTEPAPVTPPRGLLPPPLIPWTIRYSLFRSP
jgi:hypothetical protein